jgi:hypothetical protein
MSKTNALHPKNVLSSLIYHVMFVIAAILATIRFVVVYTFDLFRK